MLELIKAFENVSQHAEEFHRDLGGGVGGYCPRRHRVRRQDGVGPGGICAAVVVCLHAGGASNDVVAGLIVGSRMLVWGGDGRRRGLVHLPMGIFIMSEIVLPERGRMFKAATIGTLALGGAVAWLAIYHFAALEPVVVETPPVIKVVKQIVRVPAPAPLMPTPAPAVLHTEPPPVTPPKPAGGPSSSALGPAGCGEGGLGRHLAARSTAPPDVPAYPIGRFRVGHVRRELGGLVPFKGGLSRATLAIHSGRLGVPVAF